jgi:hypothetical protein
MLLHGERPSAQSLHPFTISARSAWRICQSDVMPSAISGSSGCRPSRMAQSIASRHGWLPTDLANEHESSTRRHSLPSSRSAPWAQSLPSPPSKIFTCSWRTLKQRFSMMVSNKRRSIFDNLEEQRMGRLESCAFSKAYIDRLKQASREWYKLFHKTLSSLLLKRATSNTHLCTMNNHRAHSICIFSCM